MYPLIQLPLRSKKMPGALQRPSNMKQGYMIERKVEWKGIVISNNWCKGHRKVRGFEPSTYSTSHIVPPVEAILRKEGDFFPSAEYSKEHLSHRHLTYFTCSVL